MSELETPLETTEPPSPPSTVPPPGADFKFGDEAPEYLRGKSASEAIDTFNRLVEEARSLYTQSQQQVEMPQREQTLDPDMVLTDPAKWQAQFAQSMQQALQNSLQQVAAPVLAGQKESARWMSQSDATNKDVYTKWGKEVDTLVEDAVRAGAVPSKALYDQAAKMIKANHLDELVAEQMERVRAAAPHSTTASAADAAVTGDEDLWEKVEKTAHGKALLGAVGKAGVARVAREQGWKLEDYLKSVVDSKIRHDPLKPGVWTSEVG